MPNPRLASRYAKSIIDLSVERDQLETVYNDMQFLQQVFKASRDFVNLLRSPVVNADKKQDLRINRCFLKVIDKKKPRKRYAGNSECLYYAIQRDKGHP